MLKDPYIFFFLLVGVTYSWNYEMTERVQNEKSSLDIQTFMLGSIVRRLLNSTLNFLVIKKRLITR